MRRPALLLLLLLPVSVGCTTSADEPALSAEDFRDGTCRTAAEDVITIGRLLGEIGDGPSVDQEILDALRGSQDALRAVAEGAEPELKEPLEQLAQSVGFIRIRAVGSAYEPFIGERAQEAHDRVVDVCVPDADAG